MATKVCVALFVTTSLLHAGLALTVAEVRSPLRDPRLVLGALIGNFVLVPAAAMLIARLFHLSDRLSLGLLLVAMECGAEDECQRVTPQSVNLPPLVKVDTKAMTLRDEESGRQSPIRDIRRVDGRIVLQGSEEARAWVLTIREDTGRMWAAVTGDEEAFIVSGAGVRR